VTVTVTFVQVERDLFVRMCSCRLFYVCYSRAIVESLITVLPRNLQVLAYRLTAASSSVSITLELEPRYSHGSVGKCQRQLRNMIKYELELAQNSNVGGFLRPMDPPSPS
jgi:hypothetical protein